MKKASLTVLLFAFALSVGSVSHAGTQVSPPESSGWHTIAEISVIVGSDKVIWVKLNNVSENYYYSSTSAEKVKLYEALLLTAFSTGREVKIYHDYYDITGNRSIYKIAIH